MIEFDEPSDERGESLRLAATRLERAGKALRRAARAGAAPLPLGAESRALAASNEAEAATADLLRIVLEHTYEEPADYWFDLAREQHPRWGYRNIADQAFQLASAAKEPPETLARLTHERARHFLRGLTSPRA